jgi:hypothetical protein
LVLLSVNPSKQTQYAVLLTSPLMMLIGHYLAASRGAYKRFNNAVMSILIVAAVALIAVYASKWRALGSLELLPLGILLSCAILPWLLARVLRLPVYQGTLLLAGCSVGAFVYAQRYLHAEIGERAAVREFVARTKEFSPVFVYPRSDPKVSFYKRHRVPSVQNEDELKSMLSTPVYVIVEGKAPNWSLPASLVLQHGKLQLWRFAPEGETSAAVRAPAAVSIPVKNE